MKQQHNTLNPYLLNEEEEPPNQHFHSLNALKSYTKEPI